MENQKKALNLFFKCLHFLSKTNEGLKGSEEVFQRIGRKKRNPIGKRKRERKKVRERHGERK